MGLKRKQMQLRQKVYVEQELQNRLSFLSGKGIESSKIDKDPFVRKLKADIRAVNKRLRLISGDATRTEDTARLKAERATAPLKKQEGGKVDKPKKTSEEGKEKKMKGEKKAAPSSAQEGGKSQT
jgi:hypothetical protein